MRSKSKGRFCQRIMRIQHPAQYLWRKIKITTCSRDAIGQFLKEEREFDRFSDWTFAYLPTIPEFPGLYIYRKTGLCLDFARGLHQLIMYHSACSARTPLAVHMLRAHRRIMLRTRVRRNNGRHAANMHTP